MYGVIWRKSAIINININSGNNVQQRSAVACVRGSSAARQQHIKSSKPRASLPQ